MKTVNFGSLARSGVDISCSRRLTQASHVICPVFCYSSSPAARSLVCLKLDFRLVGVNYFWTSFYYVIIYAKLLSRVDINIDRKSKEKKSNNNNNNNERDAKRPTMDIK